MISQIIVPTDGLEVAQKVIGRSVCSYCDRNFR